MLIIGNCNNVVVSKFGDQAYYIDNREVGKRKEYILCNENHLIIGIFYSEDRAVEVMEEIKEYLKEEHTNVIYKIPIDVETEEEKKTRREREIAKDIFFLIIVVFFIPLIMRSALGIATMTVWIIRLAAFLVGSICMYWYYKE